jgi:3-oxoacyl-[acyl-carrier-protein] synthase II
VERRVVITGLGCVTPLGHAPGVLWERLLAGTSGIGPISLFDASGFPVRMAAEVRGWDISSAGEDTSDWTGHARQTQFTVAAALQAARQAGLVPGGNNAHRRGVYLGCGEVFPELAQWGAQLSAACGRDGFQLSALLEAYARAAGPTAELHYEPGCATGCIAGLLDCQGPTVNYTSACVSSSTAIGEAARAIRRGDADVVLAGGGHSMIHPLGITGFHQLSTLSTRNDEPRHACRPFDGQRDGFVVGEGAAVVVLEELEHARRRQADICAEVSGYGMTHDAFRVTDLRPDGTCAGRCIQLALHDAGLEADEIDYINAHGTGTWINDKAETAAIKRALGRHAYRVPVSSTKSMTGHLTTACGALEVVICALALRHGAIPPTINYRYRDPDCDLDYVPDEPRQMKLRHILTNSFGFGGQNVSLALSRYGDRRAAPRHAA